MIDRARLAEPMIGENCAAELFEERHRDALRAACGEDSEIWEIYANNFGPDGFDDSIEAYTSNPRNRTFVLFEGEELAGMSSYLGIVVAHLRRFEQDIDAAAARRPADRGGDRRAPLGKAGRAHDQRHGAVSRRRDREPARRIARRLTLGS